MDKNELRRRRIEKSFSSSDYINNAFGIQAQHIPSAGLSMAIRDKQMTVNEYKKMLGNLDVMRLWGQRNTLHLYPILTLPFVSALNQFLGNWFRKKWLRVDADKYRANIEKAISVCQEKKVITRADLIEIGVDSILIDSWGGIFIDLFSYGALVPACENMKTIFMNANCIPKFTSKGIDETLQYIINLYFTQYGPATSADFAHWLGINTTSSQHLINTYGNDLVRDGSLLCIEGEYEKECGGLENEYLITARFDNLYLAYAHKDWIIDPAYSRMLWIKSGIIEASIIHCGQVVGVWRYKIKSSIEVTVVLFDLKQRKDKISKVISDLLSRYWGKDCIVQYRNDFYDV